MIPENNLLTGRKITDATQTLRPIDSIDWSLYNHESIFK